MDVEKIEKDLAKLREKLAKVKKMTELYGLDAVCDAMSGMLFKLAEVHGAVGHKKGEADLLAAATTIAMIKSIPKRDESETIPSAD